ncbi:MAG: PhzF family phenazine biosynthesis protein [Pseudomonadales bacterium]|nr:PhzF family phenazine biosynthesis protein [Pseudomonadales bacterium]
MTYAISIIDAFADKPFSGNQAAVCMLTDSTKSAQWMQQMAGEMNLSETAFLSKPDTLSKPDNLPNPDNNSWQLRWFTPTVEVNLCGHATLAAAHALWKIHGETTPILRFQTRSGELTAKQTSHGIQLDFPVAEVKPIATEQANSTFVTLSNAFKLAEDQFAAKHIFQAGDDLLVILNSVATVEALQPDIAALNDIDTRGIIITAAGGRNSVDFTSRFFAPKAGVNEDSVTGSAHCALAHFWAARLDKKTMRGYQASKRGGYVDVILQESRVLLGGQAITMIKGETCA